MKKAKSKRDFIYLKIIRLNPISLVLIKLFIILMYKESLINKFMQYITQTKQLIKP